MKLYDIDYSILRDIDVEEWQRIQSQQRAYKSGGLFSKRNSFTSYTKTLRHYSKLFPNNYLDIVELKDAILLNELNEKYLELLDNDPKEQDILKWIKDNKAYFIIASIMKNNYYFGHHDAYLIPEFELGVSYRADYLLIGQSSGGYQFVFVELESPKGRITKENGDLGEVFRKGIEQVGTWKEWLEENYTTITESYNKYKHKEHNLPKEFSKLDLSRLNYVVVAGRRKDFSEKTYRIKRNLMKESDILLLHYDNLYDYAKDVIGGPTY